VFGLRGDRDQRIVAGIHRQLDRRIVAEQREQRPIDAGDIADVDPMHFQAGPLALAVLAVHRLDGGPDSIVVLGDRR
jgi:hypothetical protein